MRAASADAERVLDALMRKGGALTAAAKELFSEKVCIVFSPESNIGMHLIRRARPQH